MEIKLSSITDYLGFTNSKAKEVQPQIKPNIQTAKNEPKQILLTWEATPKFSTRHMDEKLKRNLIVVGVVVCLLLVVLQEYLLILVVASLFFVNNALSKMSPQKVKYEITNHGVNYGGTFYEWGDLKDFFFSSAFGPEVLVVNSREVLPGRLFFNFNMDDKKNLQQLFETYLHFIEQEPLNTIDKTYLGVLNKLNIH